MKVVLLYINTNNSKSLQHILHTKTDSEETDEMNCQYTLTKRVTTHAAKLRIHNPCKHGTFLYSLCLLYSLCTGK